MLVRGFAAWFRVLLDWNLAAYGRLLRVVCWDVLEVVDVGVRLLCARNRDCFSTRRLCHVRVYVVEGLHVADGPLLAVEHGVSLRPRA